ncbi:MAG: hypothetical protein J0L63_04135 [Anaerolineae bacterium]|nr:hypothetical protein [Anaerolineae bacterium]
MSEEHKGGVKRFGRKDRKRSLDPRGPLFSPDDDLSFIEPEIDLDGETVQADAMTTEVPASTPRELEDRFPPVEQAAKKTEGKTTAKTTRGGCLPNLLSLVFLAATVGAVGWVVQVAMNPYTALNPFPPFTPIPIVITATFLPPTATVPPTEGPTATFTPLAVESLVTPVPAFTFVLADGGAVYAPNGNEQGCNWSSIAGTVTNRDGSALNGYRIRVTREGLDETVFSGATLTFGAGGFELFLNGAPQDGVFIVQLFDPQSVPVSPAYEISTRATCDEAVAILRFVSNG